MSVKIEESWKNKLLEEFQQPYFEQIKQFLVQQKAEGKQIYPAGSQIFNAFNTTPFNEVKVVIIGQDPYHGEGQAHGLSFSVQKGVRIPPSLKNIYKELKEDFGYEIPEHGNLTKWAEQGVLLLNAILTVEQKQAASHRKIGWENFTNRVIEVLSNERENIVFLLWGKFAQDKEVFINKENNHLILKTTHPSPFSAHKGFLGSKHFSKANEFLKENNLKPIDWQIE